METHQNAPTRSGAHELTRQAYTADEFGHALSLPGKRPGVTVRAMFRNGQLPAPIDPTLSARRWRWSPRVVADYIDGRAA